MYGDIHLIAPNTLFIEGLEPDLILKEPDIASSVLHKANDTLYIMDTGATPFFREKIIAAAEHLRPFKRLVVLNSHGHPDHTPNNSIINEITAEDKRHFIARAGLPYLDYFVSFKNNFRSLSEYYHLEDGPGFPFSLFMKPLKLIRLIRPQLIDEGIIMLMVKQVLKKFEPLEPSPGTATPFETLPREKLPVRGAELDGYAFGSDVWTVPTGGHTPDSVCFYLPRVKVLFLSDETTDWFNCWADSSAARVTAALEKALAMYGAGEVDVLIGGHQQEAFRGEQIPALIRRLLDQHRTFVQELTAIVDHSPGGLSVKKIYALLKKQRHLPTIDRYFRFEFPKMPGMLKTAITFALLEEGYRGTGKPGRKRFFRKSVTTV